jgi:hypothetical protein
MLAPNLKLVEVGATVPMSAQAPPDISAKWEQYLRGGFSLTPPRGSVRVASRIETG